MVVDRFTFWLRTSDLHCILAVDLCTSGICHHHCSRGWLRERLIQERDDEEVCEAAIGPRSVNLAGYCLSVEVAAREGGTLQLLPRLRPRHWEVCSE